MCFAHYGVCNLLRSQMQDAIRILDHSHTLTLYLFRSLPLFGDRFHQILGDITNRLWRAYALDPAIFRASSLFLFGRWSIMRGRHPEGLNHLFIGEMIDPFDEDMPVKPVLLKIPMFL